MSYRDHPADLNDEISERHASHRQALGSLSRSVPRFGHGSRVPGWDDAVDLTKDPAVIPDPATTPVPEDLRREIEAAMAKYPDRRSAAIPSLHAAQAVHGWCSPEAIEQVAAVMRLTPAYLTSVASFYDMFELHPKHTHDVFVCTNISCSILGADEFYDAMAAAADGQDVDVRSFECLGRVRHRADGIGRRRVRRATGARGRRTDRRGPRGRPPGARRQAAALPTLGGPQRRGSTPSCRSSPSPIIPTAPTRPVSPRPTKPPIAPGRARRWSFPPKTRARHEADPLRPHRRAGTEHA